MKFFIIIFTLLVIFFIQINCQNKTSWGDNEGILIFDLIKSRQKSLFKIDRIWSEAGDFIDTVFHSVGLNGEKLDECTTKVLEILIPPHEKAPVEVQHCYDDYLKHSFMNSYLSNNEIVIEAQIKLRKCIVEVNEDFERAVMNAIRSISYCKL